MQIPPSDLGVVLATALNARLDLGPASEQKRTLVYGSIFVILNQSILAFISPLSDEAPRGVLSSLPALHEAQNK